MQYAISGCSIPTLDDVIIKIVCAHLSVGSAPQSSSLDMDCRRQALLKTGSSSEGDLGELDDGVQA